MNATPLACLKTTRSAAASGQPEESFEQAEPMKAAIVAEYEFAQNRRGLKPRRLQTLHIEEPEPRG